MRSLIYRQTNHFKRRHLSESQRAMVAAKLANMERGRPADNSANLRNNEAAQMLNVSTRSVEMARRVEREGSPELVAAVETGKVSVAAAADITSGTGFGELIGIGGGAFFSTYFRCTNLVQRISFNPLPKLSIARKQRSTFIHRGTISQPAFERIAFASRISAALVKTVMITYMTFIELAC